MTNSLSPRAADYMLAVDVRVLGKADVYSADVLSRCVSFYEKVPSTVRLLGLFDMGYGNDPKDVIIEWRGKSISVPGEGTWQVGDNGIITFIPDVALAGPPTPAVYQFADAAGNWSNPALVVMDPGLNDLPKIIAGLEAIADDDNFWTSFDVNVVQNSQLNNDNFVAMTTILAQAYGSILKTNNVDIGANPVDIEDYDAALTAWELSHAPFADDASNPKKLGLVTVCKKLVETALSSTTTNFLVRYWRLELMSRMAAEAHAHD